MSRPVQRCDGNDGTGRILNEICLRLESDPLAIWRCLTAAGRDRWNIRVDRDRRLVLLPEFVAGLRHCGRVRVVRESRVWPGLDEAR